MSLGWSQLLLIIEEFSSLEGKLQSAGMTIGGVQTYSHGLSSDALNEAVAAYFDPQRLIEQAGE